MASDGKTKTVSTKLTKTEERTSFVPFKKAKHVIPDFEDLKPNTKYAFTFNPSDKYQSFKSLNRLIDFYKQLDNIFVYKNFSSKELYIELSPKGRLHLHGLIEVESVINFYLYEVPSLIRKGTLHINKIESHEKWHEYCSKQQYLHDYIAEETILPHPVLRLTDKRFIDHVIRPKPEGFQISDDMARPLSIKGRKKASVNKGIGSTDAKTPQCYV